MNEPDRAVIDGVVVEETLVFSLDDLCRACGSERAEVLALVEEGVLQPAGSAPHEWVFGGPSLRTARRALRLARDLELNIAGAALVIELLAELDMLRSRLRQRGG